MDIWQSIVLALIQGVSEFLPISSSAHLILVPKLSDWPDQGLAFDVVVHLGTLFAIVFYYRSLLQQLWLDFYQSLLQRQSVGESTLAWGVLLATIPVGLAGLLFKTQIETHLRSVEVIAATTIGFGLLLALAAYLNHRKSHVRGQLGAIDMAFIGCMQALALIPGTSRSGITITAGLLLGLSKQSATRFAFLLAIPVIALSSMLMLFELFAQVEPVNSVILLVGFAVSALSSYLTVVFFIKLLDTLGMLPFVVYRLLLGVILLTI